MDKRQGGDLQMRLWALAVSLVCLTILPAFPSIAQIDQAPGTKFTLRPADLPPPYQTRSASNAPRRVSRPADAALRVPAGFASNLYAERLATPRWLEAAANGDLFVAESGSGRVRLLRDTNGDGRADVSEVFAEGFNRPHGMALRPGYLYIADTRRVWRVAYQPGDTKAKREPEAVTAEGVFGGAWGHWTRNIVFSPDGSSFYASIGSAGNIAEEEAPRATILKFNADGSGQRIFATGLRNPVGIAFRPGSNELWTVVNERDGLGDGLVPDYLTRVQDGAFYGWPYAYIGKNPQPGYAERRPDLVAKTVVPDLLFESHSAPLGLTFYTGTAFPPEFRGDAFVALHGSWNAFKPTGYKVVRVPFRDGKPVGHYEIFASGFWTAGTDRAEVWGRPAGLTIASDGALMIADDAGDTIWRVTWRGN
jgi:glucose/arabinose dehydrogenase